MHFLGASRDGLVARRVDLDTISSSVKPTSTTYHVKTSKAWKIAPKTTAPTQINTPKTPLPNNYNHIHPLRYHPQQIECIYTDGSFIPPTKNSKGNIEGNTTGSRVYSPNNNTWIAKRLPGYQNILRVELNAMLIAIKYIQTTQLDTHIFTNSLNNKVLKQPHSTPDITTPPPWTNYS
jgi:hypothetical protein